jgi:hypothetical protein
MGKWASHEIFLNFCMMKIHNSRSSMSKKKVGVTDQTKLSEDMEVHHVCRWKVNREQGAIFGRKNRQIVSIFPQDSCNSIIIDTQW